MNTAINYLARSDEIRLADLEKKINDGLKSFVVVGAALKEIRDEKLYRIKGYGKFTVYCHTEWGITARRAYQLIDAAEVYNEILASGAACLPNESQSRALKGFPVSTRADVWKKTISKEKKPTALSIVSFNKSPPSATKVPVTAEVTAMIAEIKATYPELTQSEIILEAIRNYHEVMIDIV
jgi:hypothetical protein